MQDEIFNIFSTFHLSPKLVILFLSSLPVTELRASIPIGVLILKQGIWTTVFYSIIGNLLPVIPVYFLLEPISNRFSKTRYAKRFFEWIFERARRHSSIVERYEILGLMIFIGIPLPGTGVWTGCIIASLLRMRFIPTFIACLGGAIIAGLIVITIVVLGKMTLL